MNELIAKIFERRGYDRDYIEMISDQSHPPLLDSDVLVDALRWAYENGKHVTMLSCPSETEIPFCNPSLTGQCLP